MVFYINKQAVEIKTRFENAPLTSPNECCCAVENMRQDIHHKIDGKPIPSEYAEKVVVLLDGYFKEGTITDELYDLEKYAYDEQIGDGPDSKPTRSN